MTAQAEFEFARYYCEHCDSHYFVNNLNGAGETINCPDYDPSDDD